MILIFRFGSIEAFSLPGSSQLCKSETAAFPQWLRTTRPIEQQLHQGLSGIIALITYFPLPMSMLEEDQPEPEFDEERFQEAILYVCQLMENIREISETKLHKILYYADRQAYVALGEPITGESYVRHKYGPYSTRLKDTLKDLDDQDDLLVKKYKNTGVAFSPSTQKCPKTFRRPNEDCFSEEELKILTSAAREAFKRDTETVSRESHDIAWRSVGEFEEIPYDTSYLAITEPDDSKEVHQWAKEMAEEKDL